jgi:hypothetical protein
MQFEIDVEPFLAQTEAAFAGHLRATYAVSETFFEAMRPTIAAAFRNLPTPQRRLILSTTARAFARQAETETILAASSRVLEKHRTLVERARAEQTGSRRKRKLWVPHMEFALAPKIAKKAG